MTLEVWRGDITTLAVDAIVNAANSSLLGGGGVDGAIHRAAGRGLVLECLKLAGCRTGQAKVTSGHKLPARHIIHAVGPVWRDGTRGEAELLASCYKVSLEIAEQYELQSAAFPAISTGIFGYPLAQACEVAVSAIRSHQAVHVKSVILVAYSDDAFEALSLAVRTGSEPA